MRLTREVRQTLLNQNEAFARSTSYSAKNSSEDRYYEIRDGQLHVRAKGETSWADSRYEHEFVADEEQTRRFLRDNLYALNTEGLTGGCPTGLLGERATEPSSHWTRPIN